MQIVFFGDSLHEKTKPVLGKITKNVINLSFAGFSQCVLDYLFKPEESLTSYRLKSDIQSITSLKYT